MAYDTARGVTVRFGGWNNGPLADTWEWDGFQWTRIAVIGPEERERHAMAYDSARGRTVLFGGTVEGWLTGAWEYDCLGLHLAVDATCPAGGPIRIQWRGATPDGEVAVIFARNTGSVLIPHGRPCAGTPLGLGSIRIQVVFRGAAGAAGSGTFDGNAGPHACGGYLQLIDLDTCTTSNVARFE